MNVEMDFRTTLVFLAVLAINCCAAQENIFKQDYQSLIVPEKLMRHLTEKYAPDPKEVARLLAISEDKSFAVVGSAKVYQLLQLAETGSGQQLHKCTRLKFKKMEKLCDEVSENKYLKEYCDYCLKSQRAFCTDASRGQLFDHLLALSDPSKILSRYMNRIDHFIASEGEEEDPQETSVRAFIEKKLSDKERRELKLSCGDLIRALETDLFYFDPAGSKTLDYLAKYKPNKHLLRVRCQIVNETPKV